MLFYDLNSPEGERSPHGSITSSFLEWLLQPIFIVHRKVCDNEEYGWK